MKVPFSSSAVRPQKRSVGLVLTARNRPHFFPPFELCDTQAIGSLLEEYNMLKFVPLDYRDPDALQDLLLHVDIAFNYEEEVEHRLRSDEEPNPDD